MKQHGTTSETLLSVHVLYFGHFRSVPILLPSSLFRKNGSRTPGRSRSRSCARSTAAALRCAGSTPLLHDTSQTRRFTGAIEVVDAPSSAKSDTSSFVVALDDVRL